ncbi:MAG TPA: SLBB domain-containing protein [Longimicrobiaceae bacterium]|nr:SLBB domain-containing protein [Longimicrobiaceae bacterium]
MAGVDTTSAEWRRAFPNGQGENRAQYADTPVMPSILDAPVSRTEYQLGPGDVLGISVVGAVSRMMTVPVTPEGTLVVPGFGVTRVLGRNLNQAESQVRELVSRLYRDVSVSVTLAQVRTFKVFVVGDVPQPGVRVATSATRVSEVLPEEGGHRVPRRNVLLRRSSGDTVMVDLLRFRQLGELASNPTLREGDALVVPTVDQTVEVRGRVSFPGTYEYRPGESLAELVRIANGGGDFPASSADTVRVTRFVDAQRREFHTFSRAEVVGEPGRRFILRPFDAVYVAWQANYKEQKTATVLGQVDRPGVYPVVPGETTVRELVDMAGGFTPDASLLEATLRRSRSQNAARIDLARVPSELLNRTEQQIMQIRTQGDESRVVIDFPRLFVEGADAYNQTLQDGDTLSVPRRRSEVVVLGAVLQPGVVQHASAKDADYYIRLAGGYGRRADRDDILVLRGSWGTRLTAREARTIHPGDMVIVPFRERRNYLATLQTASAAITTVVGLVFTFRALFPDDNP